MGIKELGCCGAYCGTCRVLKEDVCRGRKLEYENGNRDISKAKYQIKVCCMKKGFNSCADCAITVTVISFKVSITRTGISIKKYKEATEFIMANGYDKFIEIADGWKMQYGKYKYNR